MKRFFKNIALLIVSLLVIFWVLDIAFTHTYKTGQYSKEQWMMNLEEGNYEYGILGSSRAYTTLDVKGMNEWSGKKGINLGVDGSLISSQSLMLDVLLDNGNTFETIYLQIDSYNSNEEIIGVFSEPRFMPFLKEEKVFNHFKEYGYKWYAYRYVPYLRYAEFNFDWGPHNYLNHLLGVFKHDHDETGSFFYPDLEFTGELNSQEYLFDLDGDYKYLRKVIQLCEENDIELVLFTAPLVSVIESEEHSKNKVAFHKIVDDWGLEYLDFRTLYNDQVELFTDDNHLNKNGVDKFTREFYTITELGN